MRAIGLLLLFSLSATAASAFTDPVTVQRTAAFKSSLRAEKDKAKRLELLEGFKDFLFDRLQTMDLPQTARQRADFAALNDFENNVFMFRFKTVDRASCVANWRKITTANAIKREYNDASEITAAPSTKEALEILKLLCES